MKATNTSEMKAECSSVCLIFANIMLGQQKPDYLNLAQ